MSTLKGQLKKAVTEAMKARDTFRTQALRMAVNGIQKKEIDTGAELSDADAQKVLQTQAKQIQESIDQARALSRNELIEAAEQELAVLRESLPQQMSEGDVLKTVEGIVKALKDTNTLPAGPAALGPVMKQAMAQIGSRADGKTIQGSVRKALGL